MASAARIRDRAAGMLGILPLGQSLEHQYKERIEQGYAEVYATLKKEKIAYWPASGTIPDKFAPYVVALVAFNCLDLGVSAQRLERISAVASVAIPEIRSLGTEHFTSDTINVDF